ncbi:MAG: serine/threonine protein kinase [Chloroflexota bacterium]|nr:serine/threonine protein kinase [Chloroflexota bacterium]
MEPRRIASYTLLEPIGSGGMAIVYRARQETLDRIVAVKVLSDNLAMSGEFIERFRREARTAASMRHPNVITVHDFGQDERGVPYLVVEYVEGATLADLMDRGLDDVRVPNLLEQVAAGLDYAHSRGVIHRDVKPGNVLLTEDGRCVLADFGLAWIREGAHLTMTGGVIGTPEYMSPEQASGDRVDHRTDVYALGVMLFEMLTGERPFTAADPLGVLLKHVQAPVPSVRSLRPDLPDAVDRVVGRALAKDPNERYQSAGELARAFGLAFVGSAAPATPRPGWMPPVQAAEPVADAHDQAAQAPADDRPTSTGLPCPGCGAEIPYGVGICPSCTYMIPLDQLPRPPSRRRLHRRELVVNLLPYRLRWDPGGLASAREIAAEAMRQAAVDGWEPASIGEPCKLIEGRSIGGPVVRGALLTLERLA